MDFSSFNCYETFNDQKGIKSITPLAIAFNHFYCLFSFYIEENVSK